MKGRRGLSKNTGKWEEQRLVHYWVRRASYAGPAFNRCSLPYGDVMKGEVPPVRLLPKRLATLQQECSLAHNVLPKIVPQGPSTTSMGQCHCRKVAHLSIRILVYNRDNLFVFMRAVPFLLKVNTKQAAQAIFNSHLKAH